MDVVIQDDTAQIYFLAWKNVQTIKANTGYKEYTYKMNS